MPFETAFKFLNVRLNPRSVNYDDNIKSCSGRNSQNSDNSLYKITHMLLIKLYIFIYEQKGLSEMTALFKISNFRYRRLWKCGNRICQKGSDIFCIVNS
jgi:hypothetical protein